MLNQSLKKRIILKSQVFQDHPKKSKGLVYAIFSAIAVAQINYHFINPAIATFILMAVVAHEYGHYVFAKSSGAETRHPFFFPFPYVIIGVTNAVNIPPDKKPSVALAGMTFGSFYILLFFIFNLIHAIANPYLILLALVVEILFNYFGSDGNKYRQSRKETIS